MHNSDKLLHCLIFTGRYVNLCCVYFAFISPINFSSLSLPSFLIALVTKCAGKNSHSSRMASRKAFTFAATTRCVSLSALVKISAKGICHPPNWFTKSRSIFCGAVAAVDQHKNID